VLSSDTSNSTIGFCDDLSVWDKLSHSFGYGLKAVANSIICLKGGNGRKARAAWRDILTCLASWFLYRLSLLFSCRYSTPLKACSDQG